MKSKKHISLFVVVTILLMTTGHCEKIAWLTGLESNESWYYVGFKVNIFDFETQEFSGYDVPYESVDVYFVNGECEGNSLIAITGNNELMVHRFDSQAIGEEVFRISCENELWAMSYYDGWLYAIEYWFTEEGYQRNRFVRINNTTKEVLCAHPYTYDFYNPGDDRLINSKNNHFAWFENTEMDDKKAITTGITVLINNGNHYDQKFIPLFDMEYPYHQYMEQKYHTVAPAMCWLDDENILCFLVRQKIDENFPGVSCNDAVIANIYTGEVKPYLMGNGFPLIIEDHLLSGFQMCLTDKDKLILQFGEEHTLYPTEWWSSGLPMSLGSITLSDGSAAQLMRYGYESDGLKEIPVEKSMIVCLP